MSLGKAVLLMVNVEDPPGEEGVMYEAFTQRPDDEPQQHPIARCWALWRSVKDDWPGYEATVIGNKRAYQLETAYRISSMFGTSYVKALAEVEATGPQ